MKDKEEAATKSAQVSGGWRTVVKVALVMCVVKEGKERKADPHDSTQSDTQLWIILQGPDSVS